MAITGYSRRKKRNNYNYCEKKLRCPTLPIAGHSHFPTPILTTTLLGTTQYNLQLEEENSDSKFK